MHLIILILTAVLKKICLFFFQSATLILYAHTNLRFHAFIIKVLHLQHFNYNHNQIFIKSFFLLIYYILLQYPIFIFLLGLSFHLYCFFLIFICLKPLDLHLDHNYSIYNHFLFDISRFYAITKIFKFILDRIFQDLQKYFYSLFPHNQSCLS